MNHILYLAWRYLRYHRVKTVLLVSAISLVLFLPAGLHVVVEQGAERLTARAESSPLLIGARGSAVDLTLSALYFRPPNLSPCEYRATPKAGVTHQRSASLKSRRRPPKAQKATSALA